MFRNFTCVLLLAVLPSCCFSLSIAGLQFRSGSAHPMLSDILPSELEDETFEHSISAIKQKLFSYLSSNEGVVHMSLFEDDTSQQMMALAFFDPIYHDLNAVVLNYPIPSNSSQNQWNIDSLPVDGASYYHEVPTAVVTCMSRIRLKLSYEGTTDQELYKKARVYLQMEGKEDQDPLCEYWFSAELTYFNKQAQLIGYCSFVSSLLLVELLINVYLFRSISRMELSLSKLSLAATTFCTSQDLYYVLRFVVHLMNEESDFRFLYLFPIVIFLLQLILIDIRLVVIMWRQRNMGVPTRNTLLALYILFYLTILVYVTTMFLFPFSIGLLLIQSLPFIPQIIHNIRMGNSPGFSWLYVLGFLTFRRFLLPLYEHGCPRNLFMIHPDITFVVVWILSYSIQIGFLMLQAKKGPRFFVPKRCIPGYHDYNYKYKVDFNDILDCPICLQPMYLNPEDPGSVSEDSLNTLDQSLIIENQVARAPCKHLYHWGCFRTWIDIKLECPVCRSRLPALID